MNKKRLYIIAGASAAIVVLLVILVLSRTRTTVVPVGGDSVPYEPEFMNEEEKSAFALPADSKIQVLKRGDSGTIEVYKIIREDADIVNNLEEIK